ncbi:L-glyceraldehyde 3-phosphate reductase [Phototrophicus methaneseepsis]|uniref:L-glyceraldehyde 3-phosphate reductase n=1 Tax=Phototrophicus methaneseepsis TaxID=2710758 RepID=A0A7S8E5M6_9CHLR|nr:L-glyceraldehyde 3-phosphate reductase [Phototrophicus methaneseepsis]QPC80814.1 L-glyceraldehyde 3-phosphate reductase [Phototrophicus methaneseepsis]
MVYKAAENRYDSMTYRRTGNSGLLLPAISLGIWYNFGGIDPLENARDMLHTAFDLGITHIDIGNNYGPPPGSAEETLGRVLREDLKPYRDELIISDKAGYRMWPGPYGEWGSRKYLIASCDQSLKRTGLEYFDIFYSHRPDPDTPLEETMGALDYIVRSGRALYVGISSYSPEQTREAAAILRDLGTPCLIHQPRYNMFDRWIEDGLLQALDDEGMGCICFSPLCQGILTNKYINEIPDDSRAEKLGNSFHWGDEVAEKQIAKVRKLNEIAKARGQNMAQLALAWVLRHKTVTSALIGASRSQQIKDSVAALDNLDFSDDELQQIEDILANG